MRIRTLMLLVFAFFLIVPSISQADIISTFADGDEGWLVDGGLINLEDGYISVRENRAYHTMTLIAPGKFLGDLTGYLNGELSFDVANLNKITPEVNEFGTVTITGTGGSVSYTLGGFGVPAITGEWTTLSAALISDVWDVNLASVLSNVTAIKITMEYTGSSQGDLVGFDNFSITAGSQQPVPEPGTLLLMVAGIAAIGVGHKLKKRNKQA